MPTPFIEHISDAHTRLRYLLRQMRLGVRRRTLLVSLLIGALSGVAAFLFFVSLDAASHLCIRVLMNVRLPSPAGERLFHDAAMTGNLVPWLVVLLPAVGAAAGACLVWRFAPEAAGDGMNATIHAFHEQEGRIPPRVGLVKAVASILTIGSGGSSGREGPIAQICGSCGSVCASLFRLGGRDRRVLMLSGTAAGIGAIFRTPLGGAISAVEILYKEDFESSSLIPCVISSVTSYTIFRMLLGLPSVGIQIPTMYLFPELRADIGRDLLFFVAVGLVCATVGKLYLFVYKGMRDRVFPRLALPLPLRAGLGGLGVGVIALFCTETLGPGQGLIQAIVDTAAQGQADYLSLGWHYTLVGLLTILTTSITIGSGGSGGVFGPTLVIGGLAGAATGAFCHALLPGFTPPSMAVFVLLGMAGFFAGVANATIGAVVMVCEMTASYSLLAPLLLVVVLTVVLGQKQSLYGSQVESRFHSPVHRHRLFSDVLADITVAAHYHPGTVAVISHKATAFDLRHVLADESVPFPLTVVDDVGMPCGLLTMQTIRPVYFDDTDPRLFLVRDMATPLVTCTPDESLAAVLRKFEGAGYSRIPVVAAGAPATLLGYIQYQDVMHAYEDELARRRLAT